MSWNRSLDTSGRREENIGGFSDPSVDFGFSCLVWLDAPSCHFPIASQKPFGYQRVTTVNVPEKNPTIHHTSWLLSAFPVASLHSMNSQDSYIPKALSRIQKSRGVIFVCATEEEEKPRFFPELSPVCVSCLHSQSWTGNVHGTHGWGILIISEGVSKCRKEAQYSLDVWPVQENSAPHLSRNGKNGRKRSGAKEIVFPLRYPEHTHTANQIYAWLCALIYFLLIHLFLKPFTFLFPHISDRQAAVWRNGEGAEQHVHWGGEAWEPVVYRRLSGLPHSVHGLLVYGDALWEGRIWKHNTKPFGIVNLFDV